MKHKPKLNQRGFTVPEMLLVMVVTAIIIAIAMPAMRSLIQNNRAITLSSEFVNTLHYARSEAVKRGATVSVCAAASTTACGNNWTNGWLVFNDPDGDGNLADANDILRVKQAFPPNTTLAGGNDWVTFDSRGFLTTGATNFTLSAAGCVGNNARTLSLENTGRVSVAATACP